jgi:putative ABC transport system ATP-binding protein
MSEVSDKPAVFELTGVSYVPGGKMIVNDVSLTVRQGDTVGITGPSGTGKSTLLLLMAGVFPPTTGRVSFLGDALRPSLLPSLRRRVGYVAQEPPLEEGTVHDSMLLPFSFRVNRDLMPTREDLERAVARLLLPEDILGQSTSRLSGGEKQRVAIARALLLKRDVLLLDEVTSALDRESAAAVIEGLSADGLTVVSVSHDDAWLAACERVLTIDAESIREERHGHD